MRYIVLSLSFLFAPTVCARNGVVLFDKEGKILQVNEEVLQYMDNISDHSNDFASKGCRLPFDPLTSSPYLDFLKGRPVLEFFTRQEIVDLIMDVLRGKEKIVKVIGPGQEILQIHGTYQFHGFHSYISIENRSFMGSLSFRYRTQPANAMDIHEPSQKTDGHILTVFTKISGGTVNNHHFGLYPARNMFFLDYERIRLDPPEFAILHALMLEPEKKHGLSEILRDIPAEYSFVSQEHHLDSLLEKLGEFKEYIQKDEDGRIYLQATIREGPKRAMVEEDVITFEKLRMDLSQTPLVTVGENGEREEVTLTPSQHKILRLFISSPESVNKDMIKSHTGIISDYSISNAVYNLRIKLPPEKSGFRIIWEQERYFLETAEEGVLKLGKVHMDLSQTPLVTVGENGEREEMMLTTSQHKILRLFVSNPGSVNKDMIKNHTGIISASTIANAIHKLRVKLPPEKSGFRIIWRKEGYKLEILEEGILTFGKLRMNLSHAPLVVIEGEEEQVMLGIQEHTILRLLISSPNPMSYDMIGNHTDNLSASAIKKNISSLRKKLPPEKTGFIIVKKPKGFQPEEL